MLITWAAVAFGLFTISVTKFHHYIFPAVPPMSLLVGVTLARFIEERRVDFRERALLVLGAALLIIVTPILADEPFRFINLFIYQYERNWPDIDGAPFWLGLAAAVFGAGLLLLAVRRTLTRVAPALLGLGAAIGAAWVIHGLMAEMIDFVSQRSTWEAVHRVRQPDDRIYQWAMRWRGEVWYSFDDIHEIPQQSLSQMRRELSRPGRAIVGTLNLNGINNRLRRLFGRTVEPINARHQRYVAVLWDGPPAGRSENFVVSAVPSSATTLDARLGDDVELLAYELSPARIRPETPVRVTLYFRTSRRLHDEWTVFIHGDREGGERRDRIVSDHPPADGLLPATRWEPGQIIRDEADLVTEREQRAGVYEVYVGLFNDDRRMPVREGPTDGDNRVRLGTFEIRR